MKVTDVKVKIFNNLIVGTKLKAIASIVLDEQFVVLGLRIYDGESGPFVGYPNDPFYRGDGSLVICKPKTKELQEHIENIVLEEYQKQRTIDAEKEWSK